MPLGTRWPMSQAMDFWYLTAELLCIKSEHLSFNLICSLFVCVWYVCMFVHLCACQWLPQCVCGGQREMLGKPSTSFKTVSWLFQAMYARQPACKPPESLLSPFPSFCRNTRITDTRYTAWLTWVLRIQTQSTHGAISPCMYSLLS